MNKDFENALLDKCLIQNGPLDTPCWMWTGSRFGSGYGQIKYNGKFQGVHRASYLFYKEEIPRGMGVLHHCDIPLCCNPEHLFTGTQQTNVDDMVAKNRAGFQNGGFRGQRNGNAKLSETEVVTIKQLLAEGILKKPEIANRFCVTVGVIYNIASGLIWSHVNLEDYIE